MLERQLAAQRPALHEVIGHDPPAQAVALRRANLDGTNLQDLVAGFTRIDGIALDLVVDKLYWTDSGRAPPPYDIEPAASLA